MENISPSVQALELFLPSIVGPDLIPRLAVLELPLYLILGIPDSRPYYRVNSCRAEEAIAQVVRDSPIPWTLFPQMSQPY